MRVFYLDLSATANANACRTISLAFETTLFLLTLYKFFSVLEINNFHRQPIMVTLVRDGTWAYAIIFGRSLAARRRP